METEQHFLLHCQIYSQIREMNLHFEDWYLTFQDDLLGVTSRLVEKIMWERNKLLRLDIMGQTTLDTKQRRLELDELIRILYRNLCLK